MTTRPIEDVYRSEYIKMVRFARRRLSGTDRAEDVVQEAFAKASLAATETSVGNHEAYIWKIVVNHVADEIRDRRKFVAIPDPDNEPAPWTDEPDARTQQSEERGMLATALNAISPRYARLLNMLARGLTPGQIANEEGRSVNEVSCSLVRAKATMRHELRRRGWCSVVTPTFGRVRHLLERVLSRLAPAAGQFATLVTILVASVPTLVTHPTRSVAVHSNIDPASNSSVPSSSSPDPLSLVNPERVGAAPASSAVSSSPRPIATMGLPNGGGINAREEKGDSAPPLQDQLVELINDPGRIPAPECQNVPLCPNG